MNNVYRTLFVICRKSIIGGRNTSDNSLDQFIRGAASKALLVLAAQNIINRKELVEYYRGLLKRLINNEE